jgi:hypothetical protein
VLKHEGPLRWPVGGVQVRIGERKAAEKKDRQRSAISNCGIQMACSRYEFGCLNWIRTIEKDLIMVNVGRAGKPSASRGLEPAEGCNRWRRAAELLLRAGRRGRGEQSGEAGFVL